MGSILCLSIDLDFIYQCRASAELQLLLYYKNSFGIDLGIDLASEFPGAPIKYLGIVLENLAVFCSSQLCSLYCFLYYLLHTDLVCSSIVFSSVYEKNNKNTKKDQKTPFGLRSHQNNFSLPSVLA